MAATGHGTGRTALVTGASAGIGEAFARVYATHGFNLVLTARREERLRKLADELSTAHGIKAHVVAADLAEADAPRRLYDRLKADGVAVDVLVNNAGYGVPGYYHRTQWADQARFVQVLLTAPAHLAHLFLPDMLARGYGRILNIASLAGLIPGSAGSTLYGATKSFLITFSQSLNLECRGSGVHVTAVCPGFTHSEFHDVTGIRKDVSRTPRFMWMDARTVAEQGYRAAEKNAAVYVNGGWNRFVAWFARHIPPTWALALMRQQSTRFGSE